MNILLLHIYLNSFHCQLPYHNDLSNIQTFELEYCSDWLILDSLCCEEKDRNKGPNFARATAGGEEAKGQGVY